MECLPFGAQRLRLFGGAVAQAFRRFEPVRRTWQHHAASALAIDFRSIHARMTFSCAPEGLRRPAQAPASGTDRHITRAEMFMRPIADWTHALCDRVIFCDESGQPGIALPTSDSLAI